MPLAEIGVHDEVKKALLASLASGKLPNSLLFCGQDELGMKKTALVLAQALNCLRMENDACGECSSCRAIIRNNFPDVILLALKEDDNRKSLGIDLVREIRPLALMRPMVGRSRVFIIEGADKMSIEAANALLKILEEPPFSTYFILMTTNPDLIPATIRSRCRPFIFKTINQEIIESKLISLGYKPEAAKLLAVLAQGSLEKALTMDWEKIISSRQKAWQLFHLLITEDNSFLTKILASSRSSDFKRDLEAMMRHFLTFFRDLLLLEEKGEDDLLLNPDLADQMRALKPQMTLELCLRGIELSQEILSGLERNLNAKLLGLYFYAQMRRTNHA